MKGALETAIKSVCTTNISCYYSVTRRRSRRRRIQATSGGGLKARRRRIQATSGGGLKARRRRIQATSGGGLKARLHQPIHRSKRYRTTMHKHKCAFTRATFLDTECDLLTCAIPHSNFDDRSRRVYVHSVTGVVH